MPQSTLSVSMGEKTGHKKLPIREVARETGLSPYVIRAWEKRYAVVEPVRTHSNQRLYTEAHVERLSLLKEATDHGQKISLIANLSNQDIQELISASQKGEKVPTRFSPGQTKRETEIINPQISPDTEGYIQQALEAIRNLDNQRLEDILIRAAVELSRPRLLEEVITPLMDQVGNGWREGTIRISSEHMASEVVRSFLATIKSRSRTRHRTGPSIVIATPSGQYHCIGAFTIAVTAESEGWQTNYLGADLPAIDIIQAVTKNDSRAVALSITYPPDDPKLSQELQTLRAGLPPKTEILIGGKSAYAYDEAIRGARALHLTSLKSFREALRDIRSSEEIEF